MTTLISSKAEPPAAVIDLGASAFEQRPELQGHLAALAVAGLVRRARHPAVIDHTTDRKELSGAKLLAVASALAARWRPLFREGERVGIVFPPGAGAFIANLAIAMLDRIPVNLNFTLGAPAIRSCLRRAQIETVITADAFRSRLVDFPWPEKVLDLPQEVLAVGKRQLVLRALSAMVLPASLILRMWRVPKQGGRREATVLFSSGSVGEPKGIVLSHRNVIGNCLQIASCGLLDPRETMLACLPTFHSFGFTVSLWYSLYSGLKVVTLPSPLEPRRIAEKVAQEQCTVLIGTPTFFRPYFKKVDPDLLKSLKFVVGGAEKTPPGFAAEWKAKFGSQYLEGYGLTETSPVVAVNLPARRDPVTGEEKPAEIREGSVGKLFPGMAARIVDPGSGAQKGFGEPGMLDVRGPNVFEGYLGDPDGTDAVFRDGWFVTGDLGKLEKDGYLHILGRLSRFSKIGGEMVPHGTVEQAIAEAYGWDGLDEPKVAVTGILDPNKGEALVVLTTEAIDLADMRKRLSAAGLANLWVPRLVHRVPSIPTLASGKMDLRTLAQMASQAATEAADGDSRD